MCDMYMYDGKVLGTTADKHPVVLGGWYWSNDARPVKVTGIRDIDWHEQLRQSVTWFTTTGGSFDGSRLAKFCEGEEAKESE